MRDHHLIPSLAPPTALFKKKKKKRYIYRFWQPRRPAAEAQKPTYILVRFPCRQLERSDLSVGTVVPSDGDELLHCHIPILRPFQEEYAFLRNARLHRSRHGNDQRRRHRHQEPRLCGFQRVRHLFDVVGGGCARYNAPWFSLVYRAPLVPGMVGVNEPTRTVASMATGYQMVLGLNSATV